MAITLKQAFAMWSMAPRNIVLAAKSRDAVQKVLMKKWNDLCLENISEKVARRIFRESSETLEMTVKAGSILVYLLSWGGDHGYCHRPAFTFEIASEEWKAAHPEPEEADTGNPDPLAGALFGDKKQVADALMEQSARIMNDKPKEETNMDKEKKPRGKAPKPVAQIDPETLKVVKIWPSRTEAERETGACNIDRCLKKHRMSAGYYWCMPEEADMFKPNPLSGQKSAKKANSEDLSRADAPEPEDEKRGLLETLSDDELIEELDRRGFEGELSRRVVFTLGMK